MSDYPFFKVIVLGDSNVGKTSLMNKYVHNKFSHCMKYSIGVDFTTKDVVIGDTVATLQIWDTAGQERYQSVCGAHYRGADCCVLVYDVTDPHSFENLDYWHYQFLVNAAPTNKERFPFVLVGNKIDIPYRLVSAIQAEEWCNSKNQCPYYETSAKDGINVDFAFEKIAELAIGCVTEPRKFVQDVFPSKKEEGLCFKC